MKALAAAILASSVLSSIAFSQPSTGFRSGMNPQAKTVDATNVLSPEKREQFAKAKPEDITDENFPDLIESFDYPKAQLQDVVKAISELTGKNFIIEPGLRGEITIIAPSAITVAEAYRAFLSALAINGFTIVPSGKFLKIKAARQALRDSVETYSGAYFPNSDQMITRIVHFKYINAKDVHNYLRNLNSQHGEMQPYEPTNSLIVSDFGSNIERIMKIIAELDKPGFEERVVVIPVRWAKAKDLAQIIDQIINKGSKGGANDPSRISRFRTTPPGGAGGGTTESLSLVAPDDRTNALIVVGNEAGIEKIRELVKTLDYRLSPDEAGGVFVYYVKHVDAEKLANTLQGIAQDSAQKQQQRSTTSPIPPAGFPSATGKPATTEPIFGGDVKIVADKNTNSLIITASKQDFDVVKNLLSQIDIQKDQVFVEAVILEMNVEGTKNWGISYYNLKGDADDKVVGRAGFNTNNLSEVLNPASDSGAVLGFGSGKILKITAGDKEVSVTSLLGFLKFVQTHNDANILSTPQIIALDNEEAEIEVGDEVPVGTDSQVTGSTVSTSTTFKKATIKLKIKPFISRTDSTIRMEVDQSIKQVSNKQAQAENLAKNAVGLTERSLKTNIIVQNGDTAVLGGLMRDSESLVETKVPILGDIPILGWLFKGRNAKTEKLNLLVFLTPKVIRSNSDSQQIMDKKVTQRLDFIQKNMKGNDPHGYYLDALPRKRGEEAPKGVEESTDEDDIVEDTLQTF